MRKRLARITGSEREKARRQHAEERKLRGSPALTGVVGPAVQPAPEKGVNAEAAEPIEAQISHPEGMDGVPVLRRRAGQTLTCGWCGAPIAVKRTGRLPRWCSAGCRQRAWEQERAAASGRSAVRIVDRCVLVEPENEAEWVELLAALTRRVRCGPLGGTAVVDALRLALETLEEQAARHDLDGCW